VEVDLLELQQPLVELRVQAALAVEQVMVLVQVLPEIRQQMVELVELVK
jgi:hypothetical protein